MTYHIPNEIMIPNWRSCVGKEISDPNISKYLKSNYKNGKGGLIYGKKYVYFAKLMQLGLNFEDFLNKQNDDGSILISSKINDRDTLNEKLKYNTKYQVCIPIIAKNTERDKYTFKGYFMYTGKGTGNESTKFVFRPITDDDQNIEKILPDNDNPVNIDYKDETNEQYENENNPSKRQKTHMVEYEPIRKSVKVSFNGHTYDSKTEASYAVFLTHLHKEFTTQYTTDVCLNPEKNYNLYTIDKALFHNNVLQCLLEIKGSYPTVEEEILCEKVALQNESIPVYIFHGTLTIPYPIGQTVMKNRGYEGIRYVYENGILSRDSGYVFVERNGCITIDKKRSSSDLSFCTNKLRAAYEFVENFVYDIIE